MIQIIDLACQVIAGISITMMGLSFMYVCAAMGFRGDAIGPPPTLFMGLFGIFSAMFLYGGAHLLAGDLFR